METVAFLLSQDADDSGQVKGEEKETNEVKADDRKPAAKPAVSTAFTDDKPAAAPLKADYDASRAS